MLGPFDEMLPEIVMDIDVKPEYFPTMRKALVSVVGGSLGEDVFNMEIQESWIELYLMTLSRVTAKCTP